MASVWAARDEWNGLEVIAWNSMLLLDILLFCLLSSWIFFLLSLAIIERKQCREKKNEALSWNHFHFKLPVSETFFFQLGLHVFSISLLLIGSIVLLFSSSTVSSQFKIDKRFDCSRKMKRKVNRCTIADLILVGCFHLNWSIEILVPNWILMIELHSYVLYFMIQVLRGKNYRETTIMISCILGSLSDNVISM